MANPRMHAGCRVCVRHSTPLVAQDLKEILLLCGAADVSVEDGPGPVSDTTFDAWIVEARADDIRDPAFLIDAARRADRVILVLSGLESPNALPAHIHVLEEPFRTEDVFTVLGNAGLLTHAQN